MRRFAAWALAAAVLAAPARGEDKIEFDVEAFEKKSYEFSGYLEARPEHQRLDRDAGLYGLQFPGETRDSLGRMNLAAQLSGLYRRGDVGLHFTGYGSYSEDARATDHDARFFEAYAAWQPAAGTILEAGKRTLRWGKGYAWSPVAFFERAKDPTDPELSREGFAMATGSLVRSFGGALKTLSFTPVLLPVRESLNGDFGTAGHSNPGAKLYALLYDTDIDLVYAAKGSRGARWGADFSRNFGTNFEIHGEWARASDAARTVLTSANALASEVRSFTSYVLGLRYLTERETTIIAEVYRNGAGYSEEEARRFFALTRSLAANPALRPLAASAAQGGYLAPNAMRDYLYLRVSQPEPFDILYFTPALAAIVNAADRSYTLIPEILYTGITNLEIRARAVFNRGRALTEYGEKPVDSRLELRLRWFF